MAKISKLIIFKISKLRDVSNMASFHFYMLNFSWKNLIKLMDTCFLDISGFVMLVLKEYFAIYFADKSSKRKVGLPSPHHVEYLAKSMPIHATLPRSASSRHANPKKKAWSIFTSKKTKS